MRPWTIAAAVVTLLVAGSAAGPAAATARPTQGPRLPSATATELRTPPSTAPAEDAAALGASCSAGGACVAVGDYSPRSDTKQQAVVWTRSAGRWGRGVAVAPPRGLPATEPSALTSVSCVTGTCLAAGTLGPPAHASGLLVRVVGSRVERGPRLELPSGGTVPVPYAWCGADGSCVVAGSLTRHATGRAFAAVVTRTETTPVVVRQLAYETPAGLPYLNDGGSLRVGGLACVDVDDCLLVGSLSWTHADANTLPFTEIERAGRWGPVRLASLPNDQAPVTEPFGGGVLDAVACVGTPHTLASAACTAVGTYTSRTGSSLLVEAFRRGGFHLGTAATNPTDGGYGAVACETARDVCVAAGTIYNGNVPGSEAGYYSVGSTDAFITDTPTPVPAYGDEDIEGYSGAAFVPGTGHCVVAGSEVLGAPLIPVVVTVQA